MDSFKIGYLKEAHAYEFYFHNVVIYLIDIYIHITAWKDKSVNLLILLLANGSIYLSTDGSIYLSIIEGVPIVPSGGKEFQSLFSWNSVWRYRQHSAPWIFFYVSILVFLEFSLKELEAQRDELLDTCFNPCFLGIQSEGTIRSYMEVQNVVSILVFLEFSLKEQKSGNS